MRSVSRELSDLFRHAVRQSLPGQLGIRARASPNNAWHIDIQVCQTPTQPFI
jgi:hypothetical protein